MSFHVETTKCFNVYPQINHCLGQNQPAVKSDSIVNSDLENLRLSGGPFSRFVPLIAACALVITTIVCPSACFAAPASFSLMDGSEQGTSAVGESKGTVTPTYDDAVKKDVLEFDYTLATGTAINVWTKKFPADLNADTVKTAKIGVKSFSADQSNQISIKVEIKGSKEIQTIPLQVRRGWNYIQEAVDWTKLGDLNEIAFVIASTGNVGVAKGTLSFSIDFMNQAPPSPVSAPKPVLPKPQSATADAMVKSKPAVTRTSFSLMDAADQGTAAVGTAKGTITGTFDETAGKDVLEIDYDISQKSILTISTKSYPVELAAALVNTVKIGLRLTKSEQARQIAIKLELVGGKATQSVPIRLTSGWTSLQETIDWEKIGELKQVDFVINPVVDTESVKGTLSLTADFVKRVSVAKSNTAPDQFPVFSLLDSGEKGVFNIGASNGNITGIYDEVLDKDVWKFDYTIPTGAIVGIWTKSYPEDLTPKVVDAIRVGVTVLNPEVINQVSVKVEVKGTLDMQSIPLCLKPGRNTFRELIDWSKIGNLTEVVFVVSPMLTNQTAITPVWFNRVEASPKEAPKPVTGSLYFDLDFGQVTFMQKNFTFIKVGLVLLMGLLAAFLAGFLGRIRAGKVASSQSIGSPNRSKDDTSVLFRLKLDLFYGMMTVLILGVALRIYSLGTQGFLDTGMGFSFLAVGILGVLIAELLKLRLAGKHLTPFEVFQNILLTGMLAASSSRLELLQAPATWCELFTISNLTAALAFLIYQIFNVYSLASSGKHLRAIGGALIVGTPYMFGWLLLLENITLLKSMSGLITAGLLSAWPMALELIGRLLVVFAFNEAITNGIGLVTKGRILKTFQAHSTIFLVSLGVVISPEIADLGSMAAIVSLPIFLKAVISILATMLSFGGLWGEVYLITGVLLDAGHRTAPSAETLSKHVGIGTKKGMAYIGYLMSILYILAMVLSAPAAQKFMAAYPLVIGVLSGALIFPFIKTIVETFDGSLPFIERICYSYRSKTLYGRGAVVGYGFAYMITQGMFQREMSDRIVFGLAIGLIASGGISLIRDIIYVFKKQGRVQSWRLYLVDSFLGSFVGAAAAFYLDALQVPVVIEKFKLYTSAGLPAIDYITYPLVNKWGRIDLGSYTGGVKLIYLESLAGVINWSVAAWLFAINKVFMQAYFDKDKTPIKFFFSKEGFAMLVEHMIYVLRWGLWMSPIIFTFLRMMPQPTWYNQDGAIRTFFAIFNNFTMSPEAFRAWSLQMFVYVMAFDFFRVLIWMDHMGLRVATLVNLSFLGMDKLDERISRFIGNAAAQRYIPEGVKRFTTWAPLLIPFYLPRGEDWDYAWSTSEAMQNASRGKGLIPTLQALSVPQLLMVIAVSILVCTIVAFIIHTLLLRARARRVKSLEIGNREYKVILKETGEIHSEVVSKEFFDVSRRSYDSMDPCGRILFVVDAAEPADSKTRAWPVLGNFPTDKFDASCYERKEDVLKVVNTSHGVRTTVEISLPDLDSTAEIWQIKMENLTDKARMLKVVPYLEWVLNGWIHDRFHTQYARLYPEMEFVGQANAILTWQKATKSMGLLAADVAPEGFLTSRVDFIGRGRTVWSPRVMETLDFLVARDTPSYPTFDPIGSLIVNASVGPKGVAKMRLMIGYAKNKEAALKMVQTHLQPKPAQPGSLPEQKKRTLLIGHGEIPPGTPQPYSTFSADGNSLIVHTPFTPRPVDHAMSNALHSIMVTNRGLHTSCNGNSQQNRLTPDWPDTVTKETPTEAIYLYDADADEWYSPTYLPLRDNSAKHESEFSVDGTALFRMTRGDLSTELTVFVPPEDPAGVYLLKVKNNSDRVKRLRVASYFQMVLSFQPERSGPLLTRYDKKLNTLFFENPRNIFRTGPAFAFMTMKPECVETKRGRFFGSGNAIARPYLVEKGQPDKTQLSDDGQIAGFLGTLQIPARGESTVAVILGQTDQLKEAVPVIRKYQDIEAIKKSLDDTRKWWLSLMGTLRVETNEPEFNRFQNWLKYQAVAERIWPRRGFYQTSGAYGFRDQLQDTVNLMWVDPTLARRQIKLCASQQFIEGDVFHWFFTLTDGRAAFSCRSHASDNPLWLAWAVGEYIRATGDETILDEMTAYMISEFPFAPLPKNKQGWGHLYHRASRSDTIYRHCMRSINLVIKQRTGKHGLPLMGTGDWNDGLDEIGSEGKGESVWLGLFLYYILKEMIPIIEKKDGRKQKEYYAAKMEALKESIEKTWRGDRYLRAFHDDGTEIGVKGSGIWEIDALTAAWAVMAGINFDRSLTVFNTALSVLEKDDAILLGWPALREGTKPYLGRSSKYPEGVRENGMYCHGVQWLVRAARLLAEEFDKRGDAAKADEYRATAYRLWLKVSPISHMTPQLIEIYGGQPNKQSADVLTNFERGRMIWHGYTGAAGWMLRQAIEGVIGATLVKNEVILPKDMDKPRGSLRVKQFKRDVTKSPLKSTAPACDKNASSVCCCGKK